MSNIFLPIVTQLTPSFSTAATAILAMAFLITGLVIFWTDIQYLICFVRGMQDGAKQRERSRKLQQRRDRFDRNLERNGIDVDQWHRDVSRNKELARDKARRSRRSR